MAERNISEDKQYYLRPLLTCHYPKKIATCTDNARGILLPGSLQTTQLEVGNIILLQERGMNYENSNVIHKRKPMLFADSLYTLKQQRRMSTHLRESNSLVLPRQRTLLMRTSLFCFYIFHVISMHIQFYCLVLKICQRLKCQSKTAYTN